MKTQYIKRKNKIYRLLIKNKFYKKSKKEMKMIWQTIIRRIVKIKKRVPSLKMMEATIVKVDSEKEAKNRTKDYRNYILPIIAFFTVAIILLFFTLLFDMDLEKHLQKNIEIYSELDYFVSSSQHIVFSIYVSVAIFFVLSMLFTLSNRPSITRGSFKKMLVTFLIGVIVFLISNNKANDFLTLTFPSLAIMASAYFEYIQDKLKLDIVAWV